MSLPIYNFIVLKYLDLLHHKPKFTIRKLNENVQEFQRKFVLVPADKAPNNLLVV